MNSITKRYPLVILTGFVISLLSFCFFSSKSLADDSIRYMNPDNSFLVVIDDRADLLTDSQEEALLDVMIPLTEFGHIGFFSTNDNYTSPKYYVEEQSHNNFGRIHSQSAFLIDMDNREIYVYSDGSNYKVITDKKGTIITDNIYTYATAGDYYTCAYRAYDQMYTLLAGGKILEPMRYVSAAFISILVAMLVCFIIINSSSKLKSPSVDDILGPAGKKCEISQPQVTLMSETKRYSPQSSSSGGGGGSRGGGGGGGGGHSGGGGGHGF